MSNGCDTSSAQVGQVFRSFPSSSHVVDPNMVIWPNACVLAEKDDRDPTRVATHVLFVESQRAENETVEKLAAPAAAQEFFFALMVSIRLLDHNRVLTAPGVLYNEASQLGKVGHT
jgi:hypothetical protein